MTKIIKYIYAILLMTIFHNCSLDRVPLDTISESSFFNKPEEFKLYANNFYHKLPSHNLSSESDGDLIRAAGANSTSNGTATIPIDNGSWDNNYALIRNTTYLLEKAEAYPTKAEVKVFVAEAKFFRAWAYFNLVRTFGGVPIVTTVLDVNSPELTAPRNSREEVYTLILKDLEEAVVDLPLESDIDTKDKGRISKGAGYAFISRVALFEGTWQKFRGADGNAYLDKAISASSAVMNMDYELFDKADLDDNYLFTFNLENVKSNPIGYIKKDQKEFILVRKHDVDIGANGAIAVYLLGPTRKLFDMYLCEDGLPIDKSPIYKGKDMLTSEYENRDPRLVQSMQVPGSQQWEGGELFGRDFDNLNDGGFINKVEFGGRTITGYTSRKFIPQRRTATGFGIDYPVIRLAEVYLIYAEAKFERNGTISDEDLNKTINKLRTRARITNPLTNAFASANGLDIRVEIRRERAVELLFEGFRYNDLRRWYTAHIDLREPMLGVKYKGTEYETHEWTKDLDATFNAEGYIVIEDEGSRYFSKDKNYLFPIPSRQILLNPALEQNPGW